MTASGSIDSAYAQLCADYCRHADAGDAAGLAALYSADGVFDRMGQKFAGRDAIRDMLAARPPIVWTEHRGAVLSISETGGSASGRCELRLRRGRRDSDAVETLQGEYRDTLVHTAEGWRFALREVHLSA